MAIVVAMFNHKGGVSKTTTTFHLGWMLGELGFKTLLVDADPQCNLSGLVFGAQGQPNFDEFYGKQPDRNIRAGLAPAFESQPRAVEGIDPVVVSGNNNLFLLPGHIRLSEYEVTLGIAQELSATIQTLQNLPGSLRYVIEKTAEKIEADYVLIDMSPSLGAINQNLFITSDYFIIPTAPDYFSIMALDSLANVMPKWKEWATRAQNNPVLVSAAYPFSKTTTKLLGVVIQKFRPRSGRATAGFQQWIDLMQTKITKELYPTLLRCDLAFKIEKYAGCAPKDTDYFTLAQIADFNTLIAKHQEHSVPVFALTAEHLGQTGTVLDQSLVKVKEFCDVFRAMAKRVVCLTQK